MNLKEFIQALPSLYDNWGKGDLTPKCDQFAQILEDLDGLNTAPILQLLNCAVGFLNPDEGEVYCEVGCGQGASLIGALWNNPDSYAYAVDNFADFAQPSDILDQLSENIYNFSLEDQITFCYQSFEDFFRELKQLNHHQPIGVFFYDGYDDYHAVLLALFLVKPFLSESALIVISNGNNSLVQQAVLDFELYNPEAKIIVDWRTPKNFDGVFWNGYLILSWDLSSQDALSLPKNQLIKTNPLTLTQRAKVEIIKEVLLTAAQKLFALELYAEAEVKNKIILKYDTQNLQAIINLGKIYYHTGKIEESKKFLTQALTIKADEPDVYFYQGKIQETIDVNKAITAYTQCLNLDPKYLEAYESLANLVNFSQAITLYQEALKQHPGYDKAYENLSNIYVIQKNWDKVLEVANAASKYKQLTPPLLKNLALAYQVKNETMLATKFQADYYYQTGQYSKACSLYNSFSSYPSLDVYVHLHLCLEKIGAQEKSIQVLNEALKKYPQENILHLLLIDAWQNRGENTKMQAALDHACQCSSDLVYFYLRKQLALPLFYNNRQELETYRQQFVNNLAKLSREIHTLDQQERQIVKQAIDELTIFFAAYQGYDVTQQQRQYGTVITKIISASYPQWSQPLGMPLVNDHKIRIGYVSEAMNSSSSSRWLTGWLEHRDHQTFEVFCYKTSSRPHDYTTKQIILHSDHFRDLPLDLEAIAQTIHQDNLHILVYAGIGLDSQITQLAALRLAPIQCTTWGHPVTSGMPKIDYFLSGELMEPEKGQDHYTEELVTLPNLGIIYQQPKLPEKPKTRADFKLTEDSIIYLSCQLIFKYLPQDDIVFAAIALRVPKAKFVFILRSNQFHQSTQDLQQKFAQRLDKEFTSVGLNYQDYCIFFSGQDWESYLSLLLCAEVFLDTFSFSGGYTTFEAVACSLPVVTCPGEFMRGRQSYGILQMLGVTDTIATYQAEYIDIAVRLGLEPKWRQEISQKMSQLQDNLFGDYTSIKALEEFYQQVVYQHLST